MGTGSPIPLNWVFGTDVNNTDSDFDRLNDLYEINNDLDPLKPDSNSDGLADYFEVHNVSSSDIDGDGFANAWDLDNDNDGVVDYLDLSPFSRSTVNNSFNFNVTSHGDPTYLNFQIRPEDAQHLDFIVQSWDWPDDSRATMRDFNSSEKDVFVTPILELTVPVECRIISFESGSCLEINNSENIIPGNYTGKDNQLWRMEHIADGCYSIISTGKCLKVFNSSTRDMANVTAGNYTGADHQLWKLEDVDGLYRLLYGISH